MKIRLGQLRRIIKEELSFIFEAPGDDLEKKVHPWAKSAVQGQLQRSGPFEEDFYQHAHNKDHNDALELSTAIVELFGKIDFACKMAKLDDKNVEKRVTFLRNQIDKSGIIEGPVDAQQELAAFEKFEEAFDAFTQAATSEDQFHMSGSFLRAAKALKDSYDIIKRSNSRLASSRPRPR